jgi:hypothetical protein
MAATDTVSPAPFSHDALRAMSALDYVRAENARSRAAFGGEGCFMLTEDPAHWAEFANGYEAAFSLACGEYSDVYKETWGRRPRGRRFNDLAEVEAALAALWSEAEEQAAWQAEVEAEEAAAWEEEQRQAHHAAHVAALLAPAARWWDAAEAAGAAGW